MKKLILIVLIGISIPIYSQSVEYFGVEVPIKYHDYLVQMCTEYQVPIAYAARLIQWESKWNPYCITTNPNGTIDKGLMKHNSASIPDFTWRYNNGKYYDALNWKDNMRIGIKHLSVLRKETGSWWGAVAAYNMGLTAYLDWKSNKRVLPATTLRELEFVFG